MEDRNFDKNPRKKSFPTYLLHNDDAVHVPDVQLRWRRATHAVIMAQLPSRQAFHSDTGVILGRNVSDTPRRKSELIKRRRSSVCSVKLLGTSDEDEDDEEILRISRRMSRSTSIIDPVDSEVDQFQRRQSIKSMVATLQVKRKYRDQILQKPELTGASSWHYHRKKAWQDFKQLTKNLLYQLELWSGAFKTIEGHFGTAVMSYFRFLRWLLFLNLYMTVVMVGLTMIVPLLPLDYVRKNDKNASIYVEQAENCTYQYNEYVEKTRENDAIFNLILDFLQGTGWMERTILFYGKYNETYTLSSSLSGIHTYNMGLIYLLATGIVFVLSFLLILKNSGKGVKESVMEDGNQVTQFCNKVFAGWDFCISNEKAAHEKHKILSHELCSDLESQKLVWRKEGRTTKERTKLYFIRVLINFLIVYILVGCVALIAYVNIVLVQLQTEFGNVHPVVQFLIQFLPSLTITILNFIWPVVFKKLVTFEDYLPAFEMRMTLLRIIMLRLASLLTLVISLYQQLQTTNKDADVIESCGNKRWTINETSPGQANSSNTVIKCWETYVGQQFYKLVVLDFLVVVIVTFLVEYPRRLVHKNLHEKFKLVEMIGQQEFDLPKAVLDIVYTQTLCWMGLFFCPLIPMISFLKCFLLFYIKKGSLLNNCVQPSRPYRTSKSNSLFIGVLFISFILSAGLLSYMIGSFSPSQSCGPFRLYTREHYVFFDAVIDLINTFQSDIRKVIFFFGELAFLVPAAIIVCFFMYSYGALSTGYKRKTKLLKEQLRLEGHDKQFLLARVNEAWQSMEVPASSQQTNILASS